MERNLIAREIDDLAGLRQYDVEEPKAEGDKAKKKAVKSNSLDAFFKFVPSSANSLIINTQELNAIAELVNWTGKVDKKKVPHRVFSSHKLNQKQPPGNMKLLAIHESGYNYGDAFDEGSVNSSHMAVLMNGQPIQFNDLNQVLSHVGSFNKTSIGIEFVNSSWIKGAPRYACDLVNNNINTYNNQDEYLHCFWGQGFNIYKIPNRIEQLESLVRLIRFFTIEIPAVINSYKSKKVLGRTFAISKLANWYSIAPEAVTDQHVQNLCPIERNWLQLISYKDIPASWQLLDKSGENLPTGKEQTDRNLFVMSKAYNLFEPALKFNGTRVRDLKGVFAHGAFKTGPTIHNDGCFLTLYAWLRIEKGYNEKDALHIGKVLMTKFYTRYDQYLGTIMVTKKETVDGRTVETKTPAKQFGRIVLLDVRDATLQKALTEVYPKTGPGPEDCEKEKKKK